MEMERPVGHLHRVPLAIIELAVEGPLDLVARLYGSDITGRELIEHTIRHPEAASGLISAPQCR